VNASLAWLNELLGTSLPAREVTDRLAMLGAPVDAVEPLHQDLGDVVIGLVLEAARHPNADRLSLCKVDAGGPAPLSVVCGAPNVKAGAKYPFAPVGTVLPGGIKLERRKIRGEYSEGMLCSAKELGLGEDGGGILELDTNAAPGTRFLEAVQLADTRIVIDVTPNRGDLLSHVGIARELGAALGKPVKVPPVSGTGDRGPGSGSAPPRSPDPGPRVVRATGASGTTAGVRVTIQDTQGCPRYTAAVIRGVAIGPSPAWLEQRLRALGQRPISNVVDATNYLMLENGQPLHAFDLAKLAGPEVVIRRPREGERLTTLDGQDRLLRTDTCVIADAERAIAVGGVMGGANSEVSAATTDILLECAYFDPKRTRATRRALGLGTEASYRFERGVDPAATAQHLARAVELLLQVAGGRLDGPPVDVYPAPHQPVTVFVRDARVAHVLGVDIPRTEIERVLTALGFVVGPREDRLAVQVPPWRPDVEREIDVIEEIARIVGYDRFPDEMRAFRPGTVPDAAEERASDRLRDILTGLGLHEAVTLSLGTRQSDDAVEVLNPLNREETFLRTELLRGLAQRAEHNWRLMERDVRLFEIGHVFAKRSEGLPFEELRLAAVLSGAQRPAHWSDPQPRDCDIFDVRGVLEAVLTTALAGATIAPDGAGYVVQSAQGALAGRVRELEADRPAWAGRLFGFELAIEVAPQAGDHRARPLPRSPAVLRDVALVLPRGAAAADVEATLRRAAGPLLERLWVFDEYRGAPLAAGTRSVGWRLVFREEGRTLREAEVDAVLSTALNQVEQSHGARRREN
jgi:phenylalanyl-tRNA synthetase beta chain